MPDKTDAEWLASFAPSVVLRVEDCLKRYENVMEGKSYEENRKNDKEGC